MKNTDLIIKLKSLKNIQPDEKFLKDNRELLLSQISNSSIKEISSWEKVLMTSNNLVRLFSRPVFAMGVFVLALLSAVGFSQGYLERSKPNDSFYMARIISEQVKVNTTINPIEREKLAIHFALRHAEDLATILSDEEFNNEENIDQVARYSDNFMTEVNKVETRLTRLNPSSVLVNSDNTTKSDNSSSVDATMVIADNSKTDTGLEIYIVEKDETSVSTSSKEVLATSTNNSSGLEEGAELVVKTETVKDLVERKDFSGAMNKLNERVEEGLK